MNEDLLDLDSPEERQRDSLASALLRPGATLFPPKVFPPPEEDEVPAAVATAAAGLSARATAFAADVLLCALVAAGSLLAAAAVDARAPRPAAWAWCGGFAALVSAFLMLAGLSVFGRTPGMALTELTARSEDGSLPGPGAALKRWLATAATIALAGLPLLVVLRDPARRTPADLLSGCPLRPDPAP